MAMMGNAQAWLHHAAEDIRLDSVRSAINLPQEFTGQGVIIGITDWGFDYTHPVFYDTNMIHYRVLRAWDQFKTSGPAPAGYDYGTEYIGAEALLSAQCDTSNVYDYAYHGTHCAGIAGGAGANGNRVLALGVTAGMAVGTLALLYVVPVFFMFFQRLHERFQGKTVLSEELDVRSGELEV